MQNSTEYTAPVTCNEDNHFGFPNILNYWTNNVIIANTNICCGCCCWLIRLMLLLLLVSLDCIQRQTLPIKSIRIQNISRNCWKFQPVPTEKKSSKMKICQKIFQIVRSYHAIVSSEWAPAAVEAASERWRTTERKNKCGDIMNLFS